MKVYDLIFTKLINDDTQILIGDIDPNKGFICSGNWYSDNILKYMQRDVGIFHWDQDNLVNIYILPENEPEIRRCSICGKEMLEG